MPSILYLTTGYRPSQSWHSTASCEGGLDSTPSFPRKPFQAFCIMIFILAEWSFVELGEKKAMDKGE